MIQIQCTRADVDASNARTEGECIGRTSTSAQVHWIWIIFEHQDLRMYWPNSYTSVNTFILRLIYQLNDLKRIYLTINNTLFTHENFSEPIIAPGRGMFMPMNQSEQALTKDKLFMFRGHQSITAAKLCWHCETTICG